MKKSKKLLGDFLFYWGPWVSFISFANQWKNVAFISDAIFSPSTIDKVFFFLALLK